MQDIKRLFGAVTSEAVAFYVATAYLTPNVCFLFLRHAYDRQQGVGPNSERRSAIADADSTTKLTRL